MSYDIDLVDATGQLCRTELFTDGGTYAMGGSSECSLNITYNYGPHFQTTLGDGGLRLLDKQRAGDWITKLEAAIATLGTQRASNYWAPTPGNAGAALTRLLAWARTYPDATFEVS